MKANYPTQDESNTAIAEIVTKMKAQLATGTPEQIAKVVADAKAYMQNRPLTELKNKKAGIIALQEMGLI